MDKQQIAHTLEKEISLINIDLRRLYRIRQQTIDSHQARDIDDIIQNLVAHKQKLENIVENIVEDAKIYNHTSNFNL